MGRRIPERLITAGLVQSFSEKPNAAIAGFAFCGLIGRR